ncbi:GNAT family N-acetyltransferase [Streptomyces sp. NBC_01808]|uniref:GNAT family N-acetyltransferase n=1 Tax=Streptomyces sp. NBC_01808 TaxID=2975947 RepID=UPI002DD8DE85|nr:GNAT family N-acetyltransferase [Streptomyces sp. NBC_01808]WSA35920.1 GNAT family N-acetyltransferase [Streptomyces sp. NBC_01808]
MEEPLPATGRQPSGCHVAAVSDADLLIPARTGFALAGPEESGGFAVVVPGLVFGSAATVVGSGWGWLLRVGALDAGTGAVVGYTEVFIPPAPAVRAQHCRVVVVPVHRRRGLGRWVTAELLRRLRAEYPRISEVETVAADGDAAVLALGEEFGFRAYRRTHDYRLRLPG